MGNRSTKSSAGTGSAPSLIRRVLAAGTLLAVLTAANVQALTDETTLALYANQYAQYSENAVPAKSMAALPLFRSSTLGTPTADTTSTILLVHEGFATPVDISYEDIGRPSSYDDVFTLLAGAHAWAVAQGGLSAFPTWETTAPFSSFVLSPTAGKIEQAPVADLEGVTLAEELLATSPSVLFPAVNAWCLAQTAGNYTGGYPTGGSDAAAEGGAVSTLEVVCLNSAAAHVSEIPYYVLNTFHFNLGPWPENRRDLLWTHLTAIADNIAACPYLQEQWQTDLKTLFFDTGFAFYELAPAADDTRTTVMKQSGSSIELNLQDHSTDRTGPPDFRNIIYHGLVEAAGYSHPEAGDRTGAAWSIGNWACSAGGTGTPNPPYFQSAPLQAECCFSGNSTTPTYNGRADTVLSTNPVILPGTLPDGSGNGNGNGTDTSSTGGNGNGNGNGTDSTGTGGPDDLSCVFPNLPTGYTSGTCSGTTLANGATCTLTVTNPLLTANIGYKCVNGDLEVISTPIDSNPGADSCTLPATPSGYVSGTCVTSSLNSGSKCTLVSINTAGQVLTYTCTDGTLTNEVSNILDGGNGDGGVNQGGAAADLKPAMGASFAAIALAAMAAIMM